MRRSFTLLLAIPVSFIAGFCFNNAISSPAPKVEPKRVTGIGGVFFKAKDPKTLREWYQVHLGVDAGQWGASFEWRLGDAPSKKGVTQWNLFKATTKYFQPSEKEFMINYRVANMDWLVAQLKEEGVSFTDTVQASDYGKFVHIMDPEGNKVELWEPVNEDYDGTGGKAK